jgi:hypothetical protein
MTCPFTQPLKRRSASIAIVLLLLVLAADPAVAYLKLGTTIDTGSISLTWRQMPVRYYITNRDVPNVSVTAFKDAVARAFDSWQAVPTAFITYQFAGYTAALPHEDDGLSTLGFLERPDLDRVLASTSFLLDDLTGAIIESDVFLNSAFSWSTSADGEAGHYDVESIALHEIGHLSGLGHSALGETELFGAGRRVIASAAVMFPIAFPAGNVSNRRLRPDDMAGISDLYPNYGFTALTGSVSGRVTKNSQGVFGAHVTAFNPVTGTAIGNFVLSQQGRFSIAGLRPGSWILRVEPLDDAEIDGFFDSTSEVDLDFRAAYGERLAAVPAGGDSGSIHIRVVAK